ncbi:hypothetical protein LAWI1_G005856 [Lachnellula willkommii]|uniref:NB-ARC domain-containing protein n=1 Tax=Lachnellula willkommii TaxID=215461 RepID=A0A559M8G1_9HELO|nr:hypothetical protein LAWI1_G005856 [Lachnellula willkommii]
MAGPSLIEFSDSTSESSTPLVKRALVFSSMKRAENVALLRSIYVSTYAILFIGTPHNRFNKDVLSLPWQKNDAGPSWFLICLLKESEMVREITDMFAPIMKRFAIYNFWGQLETHSGDFKNYVVEEESAAPAWDNLERCGIMATHSRMTIHQNCASYHTIKKAKRSELLDTEWKVEAEALLQPQLEYSPSDDRPLENPNEWFLVNRSPTNYFTGRQAHADVVTNKLAEFQKQSRRKKPSIFVVYGLGGSGKTQFCLKHAWDNCSSYWGVFWIDASTEGNMESGFAQSAKKLVRERVSRQDCIGFGNPLSPWLLILDNADDPDMDVSRYFPAGGNGHILITTRNPAVIEYATAGHIRFAGMDPEEAIVLLLKSASSNDESGTPNPQRQSLAQGIVSELGYLALAIMQTGRTIRRQIATLEMYLNIYLGHRKSLMKTPRILNADEANIITTWEIPFKNIVANRTSTEHKDAVTLLHIFAFIHFEHIPEEILQRTWTAIERSRSGNKPYYGIPQPTKDDETQTRLRRALRVLFEHSIIDYEPQKFSCSLHPIVYAWARDRLGETEQRWWLSRTRSIIAQCISPNLEASGRRLRRLLLPHMDSCIRALELQYPSFPDDIERAAVIEKFTWIYAENDLWSIARTLQTKVMKFRVKNLGKRHSATILA